MLFSFLTPPPEDSEWGESGSSWRKPVGRGHWSLEGLLWGRHVEERGGGRVSRMEWGIPEDNFCTPQIKFRVGEECFFITFPPPNTHTPLVVLFGFQASMTRGKSLPYGESFCGAGRIFSPLQEMGPLEWGSPASFERTQ